MPFCIFCVYSALVYIMQIPNGFRNLGKLPDFLGGCSKMESACMMGKQQQQRGGGRGLFAKRGLTDTPTKIGSDGNIRNILKYLNSNP